MRALYAAAESFLEAARRPSSKPYVEFPYPSELDELIERLVSLYPMATDAERAEARQILTHQTGFRLPPSVRPQNGGPRVSPN